MSQLDLNQEIKFLKEMVLDERRHSAELYQKLELERNATKALQQLVHDLKEKGKS